MKGAVIVWMRLSARWARGREVTVLARDETTGKVWRCSMVFDDDDSGTPLVWGAEASAGVGSA